MFRIGLILVYWSIGLVVGDASDIIEYDRRTPELPV